MSKFSNAMQDIGVTYPKEGDGQTVFPIEPDVIFSIELKSEKTPEYLGYPGYIKFQTGTQKGDRKQADDFEVWLKKHNYKYVRGYPDELDNTDRRFCLERKAVEEIDRIFLSHGVDLLALTYPDDYVEEYRSSKAKPRIHGKTP